MANYMVYA